MALLGSPIVKKQSVEGCLKCLDFGVDLYTIFDLQNGTPKSTKNYNKPMFGAILGQDGSKEALCIGLVGAKASLFIDFASKYIAFTKFPICRYIVLGT